MFINIIAAVILGQAAQRLRGYLTGSEVQRTARLRAFVALAGTSASAARLLNYNINA